MARSKFERRAQNRLEDDGWQVDWKMRPVHPTPYYNTDYFNLFDLIAYKEDEPLRFISVKGTSGVPSKHRKALEEFHPASGVYVEVWHYRKLKSRDRRRFYVKAQRRFGSLWNTLFDEEAYGL